jgi:hypothetical protein
VIAHARHSEPHVVRVPDGVLILRFQVPPPIMAMFAWLARKHAIARAICTLSATDITSIKGCVMICGMTWIRQRVVLGLAFLAALIVFEVSASAQDFDAAAKACAEQTGPQAIEYCSRIIVILRDPKFASANFKKLLVSVYERRLRLYALEKGLPNFMEVACRDTRSLLELDAYLEPARLNQLRETEKLCQQNGS